MKKFFITFISICIVLSFASIAFAANEVLLDSITVDGSSMTVNFSTAGLDTTDQITLLTYKADSSSDEATSENIKYINQIDKESNTSINFDLTEIPSGTYQVKMGGTDVSNPSIMSITVDSDMAGDIRFNNNLINMFANKQTTSVSFYNQNSELYTLEPGTNYIAAYAIAPILEGYTVKEYGIRLNGKNYKAEIALKDSKYAMLFTGTAIVKGYRVNTFPYVIYEKDGENDITYFGNSSIRTLMFDID